VEEPSLAAIKTIAGALRRRHENLVLAGIGGSTLGFRAIVQSLKGPFYNLVAREGGYPRVFVVDNVDPVVARQLGDHLDFRKTALVYISKSGSTPESAANFIYFYNKHKEAGGSSKDIVIVCDPGDNGINRIAKSLECHLLHTPRDLPGRYSVLSPVGYLPSELVGIDSEEFVKGAAAVQHSVVSMPPEENPVFNLGSCLAELSARQKSIHVLFCYSNLLSEAALWFEQLWSESLGKEKSLDGTTVNAGTTPLGALGATDQHSLLQLFKEGPNDKIFGFLTVERFPSDASLTDEFPSEKEYSYFAGQSMARQLQVEQLSTEMSLVGAGRPCYRLVLPEISPSTLGAFFYFMEVLVVFIAEIWQVNPFDQPGVEEGKTLTYSLMGREDYAHMRSASEAQLAALENTSQPYEITL